ncbi:unnamed protein product [Paramecium primaurelia]|uniref:Uncharacterized protein n=1 Tax=Paramecium primaurelia TaxID=5886 RepID=A0A8S1NPQ6_PARPR|nr:unnamed protein product [Paramecium primaurelia]
MKISMCFGSGVVTGRIILLKVINYSHHQNSSHYLEHPTVLKSSFVSFYKNLSQFIYFIIIRRKEYSVIEEIFIQIKIIIQRGLGVYGSRTTPQLRNIVQPNSQFYILRMKVLRQLTSQKIQS